MAESSIRIALAAVCVDPESYGALTQFLMGLTGAIAVDNVARYAGAEREVGRSLELARSKICVVDFDQNPDEALWVTERLRAQYPDIYVFALSAYSQPERIIAAMRAGCAEYLLKPLQNERVLEGLTRVEHKQKEQSRSKVRGKIYTVIGAKGGTGVTSLAIHLALAISSNGTKKTALIDQHTTLGDVSLYLGMARHQYSFYELASNTERLDQELLQAFVSKHDSGLSVIDSPEALDAIHYAPPAAVEQTLAFLADQFQYLVVDCAPGLSDSTLACVGQSEKVAIVMTAELPAVRNTVRYIEHLTKVGVPANHIQVLVNRHQKKGPLTDDRIEKALQRPISVRVPNSYNEVIRAINSGEPIGDDPKSEYSAAIYSWARELAGDAPVPQSKPAAASTGGLMGLFSR